MTVYCISASNIKHAGVDSTSLKICHLVKEIMAESEPQLKAEVLPLVDYELKPCIGCGKCYGKGRCIDDPTFNQLYECLTTADALFVVSAHYAPIPAKLTMLLEKMEQLAFLPRFNNEANKSPLYQRPVGIIAHGGGTEEIIKGYAGVVINTIANALSWPIEMNIIGAGEEWPRGIAIPVKSVRKDINSIFPVQEYDWLDIKERIKPLVNKVMMELRKCSSSSSERGAQAI